MVDPTAVQADAAEHDTAESTVYGAVAIPGVGTIVQSTPFHRSASATVEPATLLVAPTAVHADDAVQEIPAREPPRPAGYGCTLQAFPSQCSTNGRARPAPLSS